MGTKLLDASRWTIEIVAASAFRTAFGPVWFEDGLRHPGVVILWAAAVAIGTAIVALKVARLRLLILFIVYLIGSLTFLSCFLRYEDVHNDPIGFIRYSPRYIYLQSLAFVFLFAILFTNGWELGRAAVATRFGGMHSRRFALVPLAALLGYYYLLNVQVGYPFIGTRTLAGPYDAPDPRNGAIVKNFFANLESLERERGGHEGIQLSAQKINDWPITIDTTVVHPAPPRQWRHRALNLALLFGLIAGGYATRRWWVTVLILRIRGS